MSSSPRRITPSQHTSPQMKTALSESPPMSRSPQKLDGSFFHTHQTERNTSSIRETTTDQIYEQHSNTNQQLMSSSYSEMQPTSIPESIPTPMTTSLRLDGSMSHTHQSERNASRIGDPTLKANDPPWTSKDEAVAKGPFANTLRGDRGQSPNRLDRDRGQSPNRLMSQSHYQLFGGPEGAGGDSKDSRSFAATSADYGSHCAVHNNRGSPKPY